MSSNAIQHGDGGEQRECEACGNTFRCGASTKGCWCFQVELTAEAGELLRERYRHCLCPECLTQIADRHLPDAANVAWGEND
jgi:hypothetical protein